MKNVIIPLNADVIFSEHFNEIVAKKFSDKIDFISTFNEPAVFSIFGYTNGYMAPGIIDKEMPIHVSNLSFYDREQNKGIKVGFKISNDKKVNFIPITLNPS